MIRLVGPKVVFGASEAGDNATAARATAASAPKTEPWRCQLPRGRRGRHHGSPKSNS